MSSPNDRSKWPVNALTVPSPARGSFIALEGSHGVVGYDWSVVGYVRGLESD